MERCNDIAILEYLRHELPPLESDQVEGHLHSCQKCRERLRIMSCLQEILARSAATTRLSVSESPRRISERHTKWLLVAAVLLAGVLAPGFFRLWTTNPGDPPHWVTRQKHQEFPLLTRSEGQEERLRRRAFSAYQANDFEEAGILFSELPDSKETQFYRGVCHYFLDQNLEALALLEKDAEEESRWSHPANWFRANSLLKLGRTREAREILQKVAREDGPYQQQSQQLLDRLGTGAEGELRHGDTN